MPWKTKVASGQEVKRQAKSPLRSPAPVGSVCDMRLLFLGDIVGKPGRMAVTQNLPRLRQDLGLDFVVANGENAAGGSGITTAIANELTEAGVDGITLGDHVWDQRGFAEEIDRLEKVCRPANLAPQCPGRRFLVIENDGVRLGVYTLLGRSFMRMQADCPFRAADALDRELRDFCDVRMIEVHAETTSEKIALGWYLDGRAALVVGTHTHVPTADAAILPRGTAYHTDAGMTGPYESVLGREIQPILLKYLDGMPRRWPIATGDIRLCGTLVDFDPREGYATEVRQMAIPAETSSATVEAETDGNGE